MVSYYAIDTTEGTNFQKEISNMMHGFGDNPNPNAATVVLVENIVLQQLRSMLQEANALRGTKTITNYEIIYLMRKNIIKLRRLHDYQLKLENIYKKSEDLSKPTDPVLFMDDDKNTPLARAKYTHNHIGVIQELDEADEVSQVQFDVTDYLRKVRAAKISETMAFEKYEAYHKARCSSFRSGSIGSYKSYGKLELWINPTKEFKITRPALEVLSFLAYETVAEIVDGVYLIRQDSRKRSGDPFSKYEGGDYCTPTSLSNTSYVKSGYEGVSAITVAEVREVLRRYFTPSTGMNGLFSRNISMELPIRYIAI